MKIYLCDNFDSLKPFSLCYAQKLVLESRDELENGDICFNYTYSSKLFFIFGNRSRKRLKKWVYDGEDRIVSATNSIDGYVDLVKTYRNDIKSIATIKKVIIHKEID